MHGVFFDQVRSAVLAGVLVLGVLWGGQGCERRARSPAAGTSDASAGPRPTHVSWEATFTLTEGGQPRAVLRAPRMEQYRTSDSSYSVWRAPDDTARVHVYLFGEAGDSSATVVADSLVFQDEEGRMDAYHNVVVTTQTQKRLRTEHLIWRQSRRTLQTRRFVRIRTPTEVVQGNGLVAEEDLETYQLGRFSAEVDVEETEDTDR